MKAELENIRLINLLKRDHRASCACLRNPVPCDCGWNEGIHNADEEIATLKKRLVALCVENLTLKAEKLVEAERVTERDAKVAEFPYSDNVAAFGFEQPSVVGKKIAIAIRAAQTKERG